MSMLSAKPPYEPGMKIRFDRESGQVTVTFRGRITVLPGNFTDEAMAVRAGERHCQSLGWGSIPNAGARGGHSLLHKPLTIRGI
jgi:hypothetical protein